MSGLHGGSRPGTADGRPGTSGSGRPDTAASGRPDTAGSQAGKMGGKKGKGKAKGREVVSVTSTGEQRLLAAASVFKERFQQEQVCAWEARNLLVR